MKTEVDSTRFNLMNSLNSPYGVPFTYQQTYGIRCLTLANNDPEAASKYPFKQLSTNFLLALAHFPIFKICSVRILLFLEQKFFKKFFNENDNTDVNCLVVPLRHFSMNLFNVWISCFVSLQKMQKIKNPINLSLSNLLAKFVNLSSILWKVSSIFFEWNNSGNNFIDLI